MELAQNHPSKMEFSVLLIKESSGWWSAQCLEYDIVAQAKTLEELKYEFQRIICTYFLLSQTTEPGLFQKLGRAPSEFWDLYARATEIEITSKTAPVRSEPPIPVIPSARYRVAEPLAA